MSEGGSPRSGCGMGAQVYRESAPVRDGRPVAWTPCPSLSAPTARPTRGRGPPARPSRRSGGSPVRPESATGRRRPTPIVERPDLGARCALGLVAGLGIAVLHGRVPRGAVHHRGAHRDLAAGWLAHRRRGAHRGVARPAASPVEGAARAGGGPGAASRGWPGWCSRGCCRWPSCPGRRGRSSTDWGRPRSWTGSRPQLGPLDLLTLAAARRGRLGGGAHDGAGADARRRRRSGRSRRAGQSSLTIVPRPRPSAMVAPARPPTGGPWIARPGWPPSRSRPRAR